MDILAYIFAAILILTVAGVLGLLFVRKPKTAKIIFVLLAILAIGTSAMATAALPSNYIFKKVISGSWGVLAVISLVMSFIPSKYQDFSKYLLILSALGAVACLFFM